MEWRRCCNMNNTEFIKDIPADQIAIIFKDFFEQHMLVYDIIKNADFVSINDISIDSASIMYRITMSNGVTEAELKRLLELDSSSLIIYGKEYKPNIFINGDLLCITINK